MKNKIVKILKNSAVLIPAMLAFLMFFLLPEFTGFTETVITGFVFKFFSYPLGFLVSAVPLSFTEISVVFALPLFILIVILLIRKIKKTEKKKQVIFKILKKFTLLLSCVLLFYMIMHGGNFYRRKLSDLMGFSGNEYSAEFLTEICIDLAKKASAEREHLTEAADGSAKLFSTKAKTLRLSNDGFMILSEKYPFLKGSVYRAKPVQLSHVWSYTNITGMYFPFFAEANVNIDQPEFDIPFTAAHELAHTRGFAREDECNFLAYLTCIINDSADIRYSGYLNALIYCHNALSDYDGNLADEVGKYISDGMYRDFDAMGKYWEQFKGKVAEASEKVNDAFIESQGVEEGTLSYGLCVELIAGYYEKTGILD